MNEVFSTCMSYHDRNFFGEIYAGLVKLPITMYFLVTLEIPINTFLFLRNRMNCPCRFCRTDDLNVCTTNKAQP